MDILIESDGFADTRQAELFKRLPPEVTMLDTWSLNKVHSQEEERQVYTCSVLIPKFINSITPFT